MILGLWEKKKLLAVLETKIFCGWPIFIKFSNKKENKEECVGTEKDLQSHFKDCST